MTGEIEWINSYRTGAKLIYEVDADIYDNPERLSTDVQIVVDILHREDMNPDKVLDLACGPGGHLIYLASHLPRSTEIHGSDYSEGFLQIAQSRLRSCELCEEVHLCQNDMRCTGYPPHSFDLVTLFGNSYGFFSEEDNFRALAEINRILKPGGILIMNLATPESARSLAPFKEYLVDTPTFGKIIDQRYKIWDPVTKRSVGKKLHTSGTGTEERVLLNENLSIRVYDHKELENLGINAGYSEMYKHEPISNNVDPSLGLMSHTQWIVFKKSNHEQN